VTRAFLGLGSNLGDRAEHLRLAVLRLPDVVTISGVYETDPVGGPDDQGPYLNLVVELDTDLDARGLLALAREREAFAGRVREVRWGARTLDSWCRTPGCASAASSWPPSPASHRTS